MAIDGEKVFTKNLIVPGDDPECVPINDEYALYTVRSRVMERANRIGMPKQCVNELEIIVRELVSNVLKHSRKRGHVIISHSTEGKNPDLVIDVVDQGPGFEDFEKALEDGYSSSGSLGAGLPTVLRFAEHVELVRSGPNGSHIRVHKSMISKRKSENFWEFTLFIKPHMKETIAGDYGTFIHDRESITVVLADGLGHGPEAAVASQTAVEIAFTHSKLSLVEMIQIMHKKLMKLRGAAISLARINPNEKQIEWLGIGNVAGGLVTKSHDKERRTLLFTNYSGTVGVQLRAFQLIQYKYQTGDWLVLVSDGFRKGWVDNISKMANMDIRNVGHKMIRKYTRPGDDASILIGRSLQ